RRSGDASPARLTLGLRGPDETPATDRPPRHLDGGHAAAGREARQRWGAGDLRWCDAGHTSREIPARHVGAGGSDRNAPGAGRWAAHSGRQVMTKPEQTRAELLAALAELSRVRPEWRLGQMLANVATTAGRLDPGGVWELEDEEALAAVHE